MIRIVRYSILFLAILFSTDMAIAQVSEQIRGLHKVKRKETIFGIARQYDIQIEELFQANPEMRQPDYELKKGDVIRIPYKKGTAPVETSPQIVQSQVVTPAATTQVDDVRERAIRVGVMLPLHNINGDGRRMVEYYRGILMACDSVKKLGISVDLHAWNTPEDGNISTVLSDKAAADCDIIFGPLYSKQMEALSNFVNAHDIRLVIPFSISAPQLLTNRNIFQIWQ